MKLSCFYHDPVDVGNLISGSSAFSKTSLNIRKFPLRRKWQPIPVFLPGKSHGYTEDSKDTNALPYWRTKEPEIKLPTSAGSSKNQQSFRKTCALLTMPKPLTVWMTINWKILKEMGIPDHLICLLRNLYAGQEPTVRTGHGTTDWFQIGKGVRHCHLPKFHIYVLVYCIGVFLSGLLHSV